jgi:hypothetical protein
VHAFNALTPRDCATTLTRLGITPRRCSTDSLGKAIPATVKKGRCQPRDTVPPTLVRLMRQALEGGPAEPSNAFLVTTQGYSMTSGRRERPSSSLSVLCGHPRPCSATPRTATALLTLLEHTGTGHRHTCHCASYGCPLTAPSNRPTGGGRTANLYATTLKAAPVRAQDAPRRHDLTRFARTVVNSVALLATPPHVGE